MSKELTEKISRVTGRYPVEYGLCRLHDSGLKPTEGKLSYHLLADDNFCFERSLSWNVAKEWIDRKNIGLITKILQHMKP